MCLCVAFLILRRMCRWDCCSDGGSFRILRPMCRLDLLCRWRLLPDPSSAVSVGFAVSPGLRLDPSSDVSVVFAVSLAAPSGSFVRCVGWICCAAKRILQDPSSDVSV
jgi:hypothetical protein